MRTRYSLMGVVGIVAIAFLSVTLPPPRTQAQPPRPKPPAGPAFPANVVKQGFPAAKFDAAETERCDSAWEIEWELTHPTNRVNYPPGCVLRIKSAKFMWKDKTGKAQWLTVVRNLELGELYVPYDNGTTAFLDIHDMPFNVTPARKAFLGPNCVAPGEILPSTNPAWANTVHKEVHDDGPRWMTAETSGYNQVADRVRRGEKMTMWSTYYGANYRYIMEYTFTDDGQIQCRIGPTARNFFTRRTDGGDTHVHVGCWRMEMDLGNPKDNDILVSRRILDEEKEKFIQVVKPFNKNPNNDATEGSLRWNAEEFTTLRIASRTKKNSHGRAYAYDLVSQRQGSIRNLQPEGGTYDDNLDFVNQDFWVTRTESGNTDFVNVPKYAKEKRPLTGQPTTIWLSTAALHVSRSEDFSEADGTSPYGGVATLVWAGFSLKPRDIFDGTPLYKPTVRTFR
jgi:hypothetical protein